jgi:hypothetical protein
MSLAPGGKAVNVTAFFYNSSGRDLRIAGASADLPGATVLGIELLDEENISMFTMRRTTPLPEVIDSTTSSHLVISFVPTSCQDDGRPWGTVNVQLDVVNDWLPSIDRSYTLPGPVVDAGPDNLAVFPPEGQDSTPLTTPLAAACALLGLPSG